MLRTGWAVVRRTVPLSLSSRSMVMVSVGDVDGDDLPGVDPGPAHPRPQTTSERQAARLTVLPSFT